MNNTATQIQTQSRKPKFALVRLERSESRFKKVCQSVRSAFARLLSQSDDVEAWRRLEYRNEIPREREFERSMWRM